MLIRSLTTTFLKIFCELLLNFQIIYISMRVADDTFQRNSECEWVKDSEKHSYRRLSALYGLSGSAVSNVVKRKTEYCRMANFSV